jgi:hypothetical protein
LDVLNHDKLLDAFEFFESALDLLYVNKAAALLKKAKQTNANKGPKPLF